MKSHVDSRKTPGILFWIGVALLLAMTSIGCSYTQLAPPRQDYHAYDDYEDEYYEDEYVEDPPVDPAFAELSYYGQWIAVEPYGWVWQPDVISGWRPFHHGHWVMSGYGWTWVSYESFGWATYHYGHWLSDPAWGWFWTPGYDWHPARVRWITYDDYVCWAPLPPSGHYIGDPWTVHSSNIWIVVRSDHFTNTNVSHFAEKAIRRASSRKTVMKVKDGPDVGWLERQTRRAVRTVDVQVRKVKVGDHEIQRVSLPKEERKKVDRYKPRVERKVMKRTPDPGSTKSSVRKSGEKREVRKRATPPKREVKPRTKKSNPAPKAKTEKKSKSSTKRKSSTKSKKKKKDPKG
jgi:hypothetical protein